TRPAPRPPLVGRPPLCRDLVRPGAVRPLGTPLPIQVAPGLDALPVGGDGLADAGLGPRRLEVLAALQRGESLLRLLECRSEGSRAWQGVTDEGGSELRDVAVVAATEGRAVGRGRSEDRRALVRERRDEGARVAGRDDDHAPLDARVVEGLAQGRRVELL